MLKRILFAVAFVSGAAAAQEVDINGKDFLSGAGDARLAEIARQAAASGKKLVVTAPAYWQSKVAGKLHVGAADANVQMSEGFFENVVVKVVDNRAEAKSEIAKPVPADAAAEKPAVDKAAAEKAAVAKAAAAKAATEKAAAEQAAADKAAAEQAAQRAAEKAAADRVAAEKAAAEKVVADKAAAEKAATEKIAAEKAATEKAAADKLTGARQRMEKNLNVGHPADGSLTVEQLQKADELFVDGPVRGVVRRSGAHSQLYWLEGELNLERVELVPSGDGHYVVADQIRFTATPVLRSHGGGHLVANVPAPNSAERTSLQQQYAEGREISETAHPADLRAGDIIYSGTGAAMVVRRSGTTLLRFWLDGDLNLSQAGLSKQSGNAYRVLSDTIK